MPLYLSMDTTPKDLSVSKACTEIPSNLLKNCCQKGSILSKSVNDLKVGDILHYGGCGWGSFYQIIRRTAKTVKVQRIKSKYFDVEDHPTFPCKELPIKDAFNKRHDLDDDFELTLRLNFAEDRVGPLQRMVWWSIFDGEPVKSWSP